MALRADELARIIDLTLLKPTAKRSDVISLCRDSVKYGFGCVIVSPSYVKTAVEALKNSEVKVGTVVGFPLGFQLTDVKVLEAHKALTMGAREIDMVMNIGAFKSGEYGFVEDDIKAVVKAAKNFSSNIIVKVIIETCYLTDEEKDVACRLVMNAGADFVKTSTGFGPAGATVHDVKLIRRIVGEKLKIKAAGGIRSLEQALKLLDAGADRLGASAGVKIVEELLESSCTSPS